LSCTDAAAQVQHATDVEFSVAFQPIVDVSIRQIVSFEALVRGRNGEPAAAVFARVPRAELHRFDQACRLKAIHLAARLDLRASLNLNFIPGAFQACGHFLEATLQASQQLGFPVKRLVFEVAETEHTPGQGTVQGMFEPYSDYGFQTAIDDFGAGFAGLRRWLEHRPDYVKLDQHLVADIHCQRLKQVVVQGIRDVCQRLAVQLVAEGVETAEEYCWLKSAGIHLLQGYYFARPSFESLAQVEPARF
jgi:EAL domain-containing protein (putative c-di-GMP-specific phosphodiesterase class I)